jgi:hypothetical protein
MYCPALKSHIQQFIEPTHSTKRDRGLSVFSGKDELPLSFNISFMMNARPSFMMQAATSTVVDSFFSKPLVNSFFTGQTLRSTVGVGAKWLFPEPRDVEGEFTIWNGEIMEHEWVDIGLNQEQRVSDYELIKAAIDVSGVSAVGCFVNCPTSSTEIALPHLRTSWNRENQVRLRDITRWDDIHAFNWKNCCRNGASNSSYTTRSLHSPLCPVESRHRHPRITSSRQSQAE